MNIILFRRNEKILWGKKFTALFQTHNWEKSSFFNKSSISIHFVFLRVALVNTESVVGSGCLWACGELGANIHSVSGRRRSRREVPFHGFRMFLPMQIEFSLRLSTVWLLKYWQRLHWNRLIDFFAERMKNTSFILQNSTLVRKAPFWNMLFPFMHIQGGFFFTGPP